MSDHAKLSPSKRSRWALCPGSIREEAKYPDTGSGPAAADGTHSHTLLEHCIKNGLSDPMDQVGETFTDHEGTFKVDADRAARVKSAIEYIRDRSMNGLFPVISEQKVNPKFLLGRDDLSGTVDCQIIGPDWIELIDYKDGMGVVSAEGNMQLEQYAYGVLAGYSLPVNGQYSFNRVIMTIIQPKLTLRGMPAITSYEVSVRDLMANMGTIISQAAATDKPDAPLVPGESQCKFCRAKGSCNALASNVMKEVGIMFQPVVTQTLDVAQQSADKDPSTMDDQQIRQIMEAAPLMRQLLEGVEKEALRRLKAGQTIPGLKLVNGKGSRSWAFAEAEMADKLVKMGIPKSAIYETKLVSPAKAEKLTWKKKDEMVTLSERQLKRMEQEYVTKLAGALTVVPESDGRPAVITNAAPLFSAVEAAPAAESLPSWLS
ncbi:Protein of unknown function DUF2800 [uncultured Caudovirales phage]|uniref:DUF2800 domain-containing protein n=1 Tax=uncultured Caudovirales phage TaxID=2100421 RepID=A0A6J7WXQ1_9CAUD|nr:Protein of unknown function DUF2800 [uncultured Caudovirales phage]